MEEMEMQHICAGVHSNGGSGSKQWGCVSVGAWVHYNIAFN